MILYSNYVSFVALLQKEYHKIFQQVFVGYVVLMVKEMSWIRRFRDRFSSVVEIILVLTQWDKANTLYIENVVYICFKISFAYFACQLYLKSSKSYVRQTHD